jgi:stage III sporulation protein AB
MPFLIAGVLIGATYVGYKLSRRYAERERFFLELVLLCDRLTAEIRFSHSVLREALERAAADCKSGLSAVLETYGALLASFSDTGPAELRAHIPEGRLKPQEYDLLLQFLGNLGKADAETELVGITGFRAAFEGFHTSALAEKKRYGGLYTKLGFLAGLIVSVLLL